MKYKQQLILLYTLFLFSCYDSSSYRGDGELIDYGWNHFIGRYMLVLGEFNLADSMAHNFNATNLPGSREFVIGFEIDVANCIEPSSNTLITLQVINERGNLVIDEKLSISEFRWSRLLNKCKTMFGYKDGKSIEKLANNMTCNVPIYTGDDKGSGTYFVSRSEGKYKVNVNVYPSRSQESVTAKLVFRDNGSASLVENNECNLQNKNNYSHP